MPEYVTIKLYADTRRLLRLIAAETGEQMVQVMQRLCEAELGKSTPEVTPAPEVTPSVKTNKRVPDAE